MKDRSLSGPGVQVLLVGTGSYKSTIPDIPAVSNNLQDLGQVLIAKCGLNSSNLRLLTDPELPYIVGDAIIEAAERSTTVLLFYYVGHGFVSSNGDLYLSVAMTDRSPSRLPWTGIRYDSVRAALLNSRAQTTVVLLDCCFSGRAVEALAALSPEDVVADLTGVQGGYIMTASAPDELALAPAGEKYTAFTGELIRLLHDGSTECGRHITLAEVYQTISSRMRQRGMPVPRQRVSGTAGGLLFRENSAYVKGPTNNAVDPIYNSDDEWDTFRRDWGYFDSSGQYAGFFDLPGTAQMQSDGAGDVGLNKSVASLYGVVEFEFLVNSNSPTSSPVFF